MSFHFAHGVSCPSCGELIEVAKVESNDQQRGPVHGDNTVCSGCCSMLKYVEGPEGLALEQVSREEFEAFPEAVQARLMTVQAKVSQQGKLNGNQLAYVMAQRIVALEDRMASLEASRCACYYCKSGDGFNCNYRRRA